MIDHFRRAAPLSAGCGSSGGTGTARTEASKSPVTTGLSGRRRSLSSSEKRVNSSGRPGGHATSGLGRGSRPVKTRGNRALCPQDRPQLQRFCLTPEEPHPSPRRCLQSGRSWLADAPAPHSARKRGAPRAVAGCPRHARAGLGAAGCRDWGVTQAGASQWIASHSPSANSAGPTQDPAAQSGDRDRGRCGQNGGSGSSEVLLPRGAEARRPPFRARAVPQYGNLYLTARRLEKEEPGTRDQIAGSRPDRSARDVARTTVAVSRCWQSDSDAAKTARWWTVGLRDRPAVSPTPRIHAIGGANNGSNPSRVRRARRLRRRSRTAATSRHCASYPR